jgi:hypothetical protein
LWIRLAREVPKEEVLSLDLKNISTLKDGQCLVTGLTVGREGYEKTIPGLYTWTT